jgi:Protein of unknown function (DUF3093)
MGSYRERLLVPVSYWLLAVPVVVTLGAEAYFFVDGFIPPLVILALFLLVAAFFLNWSSATIEVTGAVLKAGGDTLALSEADEVTALDEKQAAALGGPRADPSAHILLRPYLKRAVCIALADPAEGVPYWLVATRHPEELAAAIEGARRSASHPSLG